MAWTSGFFNSVNGDRRYNAEQMSEIFTGLITDGVYESVGNKLAVQPNNGMTIQINTGRGWFGGRWVNNDSIYLQALENSDVLLNRYCAVCVRVDYSDGGRKAEPYFKYSDYATAPVKPEMERTELVKEYCLAYVYIKAGASEITAADIEDTRPDNNVCGWVTGLIEQLDSATLWQQFEGLFEQFMNGQEEDFLNWYNSLIEYLDADVETKLVNDVLQLKGRCLKATGTLLSSGWTDQGDGTYLQTVTVNGVTADNDIFITPANEDEELYINMNCKPVSQERHSITFECTNPQSVNVSFVVMIFNVDTLADVITESVNTFTVTDDGAGNVSIID